MFSIIRGGCHERHDKNFILNRPNGLPYFILLIIKTPSMININGSHQYCFPDSALIISPNTPYSYNNPDGEYIDDWLHFECNDYNYFDASMLNVPFPINNSRLLTTYIQQILWENNYGNDSIKKDTIDALMKIVINHITYDFQNKITDSNNYYKYKFQKIRLDIQAAPYKKYTAKDIADNIGISSSHFQLLYKNFFGISFQADIINMRVDYSKELITSTNMPQEQIAYSCGYSSEVHFYRQFLSKTGMTPGAYRNLYS